MSEKALTRTSKTLLESLVTSNNREAIEYLNSMTVSKIVKNDPDNLIKLKTQNKDKAYILIRIILSNTIDSMNIRDKWDGNQIDRLATHIMTNYDILTIEDLYIIMSKVEFSPSINTYGSLSGQNIIEEIDNYLVKKEEIESDERKKREQSIEVNKEARESNVIIDELIKKLSTPKKVKVDTSKPNKPAHLALMENCIHQCITIDRKPEKIASVFNLPIEMASKLKASLQKYKISTGDSYTVLYPDINNELINSKGKFSEFGIMLNNIMAYYEDTGQNYSKGLPDAPKKGSN